MATGTRAAKQMEEQIGTLLTMLQEQGQRQEQLAQEQANEFIQQMEQLKEEQRERQAEFSDHTGSGSETNLGAVDRQEGENGGESSNSGGRVALIHSGASHTSGED